MKWYSHCNGLDTYNQVAVSNGKRNIVLADLARFEEYPKYAEYADLWAAGIVFATAYAAALNKEEGNDL